MARRARAAAHYPLHLLANQPATRLHSQLDIGAVSQGSKVQGREPIRMHPVDAAARGLVDGDVVRVFNDRGACLAGVVVDDRLRPDVVQLSTGAWFDPADPADPDAMCVHGNPNVLTDDVRHVVAGAGLHRRACAGAGGEVHRAAAAGAGARAAGDFSASVALSCHSHRMAGRPSGFKTAAARAQYCVLYDEAIAQSPVPVEESDIRDVLRHHSCAHCG